MKKLIVTSLLMGLITFAGAQKVIEWPEFSGTTAPYVKITKIALTDTATAIDFRVHFKPFWWIQIPKKTWIKDSKGGEKRYVKNAKGIKIGERHRTPQNGVNEYTLYFPPVEDDVEMIDYEENQWKTFDIELVPQEHFSIFPENLTGNWLRTDGSNEWVYGFYEDRVICDSEIWKQVLISQKDDVYHLMFQKNGKKKKLVVKPQEKQLLIGPDENNLQLFSTEMTSNSAYQPPNDEGFELPVFTQDSAYYKGYIKGYDPRMGETGMIYVNNILSHEQESYLIDINDDGTFSVGFPMLYPQPVYVRFLGNNERVYFEPGKTTFRVFDLSRYHDYPGPANLFMGETAKVNGDLMSMEFIRFYNYRKLQKKILDMSPEEYIAYFQDIQQREMDTLETFKQNHAVSKKAQQMKEMMIRYGTWQNILSYNMNRISAYRRINEVPRDQREIPLERVELEKEFFDFIEPEEVNNPLAVVAGGDYSIFINRVKFSDPVRMTGRISVSDFDITAADFERKGIVLDPKMKELLNKLAECQTKEDLAKLMVKDSALYRKFRTEYDGTYSEIRSEKINELRVEKYKKGFREYFGFDSGFAMDIMKAQDVAQTMKRSYQPLNEFGKLSVINDIENKFVVNWILDRSNELEKEINIKLAESKNKTGAVINETPETDGDLFDAIMQKYRGKVVFVDFWATWCGPCRRGMERIKPLKEELKDKDIVFVYITNPSSPERTWNIMVPGVDGEHYRVTQDEWNKMAARFKVSGIPHYVLVGKDGEVLKDKIYFASSNAELKRMFEEYLK